MKPSLLDVNVLVALFDPAHPNHDDAHRWFGQNRKRGWATCPLTVNGCVRVLSNPSYPSVDATAAEVISRLRALCESRWHHFWPDEVSRRLSHRARSREITSAACPVREPLAPLLA